MTTSHLIPTTDAEKAKALTALGTSLLTAGIDTSRGRLHPDVFEAQLIGATRRAADIVDDHWYAQDLQTVGDPSFGTDPEDRAGGIADLLYARARRYAPRAGLLGI